MKQVLHMQGIDTNCCVIFNDFATDKEWLACLGGSDTIHRETTGQTSYTAEQAFESLDQIMRYVVLVDLDHSDE